MNLKELLKACPVISFTGDAQTEITTLVYDSRKAMPGSLFVCINGTKTDGHSYIQQAWRNGCRSFVVERAVDLPELSGCNFARVHHTRRALAALAARFYGAPSTALDLVAVNGRAGKHTLAYLLYHFCRRTGRPAGLMYGMKNYYDEKVFFGSRNHPGAVELQAAMAGWLQAAEGAEANSGELGAESGDAKDSPRPFGFVPVSDEDVVYERVAHTDFKVGVMLNTESALNDSLFDFYRRCQYLVLNRDDVASHALAAVVPADRRVTIAIDAEADIRATAIGISTETDRIGTHFLVTSRYFPAFEVFTPLPGRFNIYNLLALIAVFWLLGVPVPEIAAELPHLLAPGRTQPVWRTEEKQVYIDSAWRPRSLETLLLSLRPYCRGRLLLVCGCSGNRDRSNRTALGRLAGELADFTALTVISARAEEPTAILADMESGMLQTKGAYLVATARQEAIYYVLDMAGPDDLVILAGKGEDSYEMDEKEMVRISDLKTVRNYFLGRAKKQNGAEA